MKVEYIIDESANYKSVLINVNDWKKLIKNIKIYKKKLKMLNNLEKL